MAKTKQDRKVGADKSHSDVKGKELARSTGKEERVPVRLFEVYKGKIVREMMKKFGYKNLMQVPKLEKICINVGVGQATQDPKLIDVTVREIEAISGQKPVVVKAKKSVSNFKLREGMNIGVKVTLRNARMYEFLDRFINVSVPRIRDFRGLSDKCFDGRGNCTIGIKEQIIFTEINVDHVNKISGMDITFVTTAGTDEEAFELLRLFGVPFISKQNKASN
ncbi:MAG: 50S ribosomal protein L5 [Ignavibacteriaceae bacterium]|jgi:LSU ribosomal protein L5P|nr:MAG: 50S ribosomal protein L5 [Chlorobiota bacterium]KXK06168.1 MAG: 50S ribosomal protein L5 [Chlorobi bacterium OLB4]MBV6398596.1 50S ribosomal protein L5 [Ignavibacteria bacterium]MCC6885831.1 50S ribosomal protein L5 [Ignavibacteriales bacterium]MCE7952974.1 50S ribosomal protein L5 [Chlorobi bacterium CHB7]MDL1887188.1 50S ribosomal protein L5 [Ignavibacteria bacterium CHB1]MEB2329242.1 50S ribosomal protein L5 [Ignavibacteriaceae bacterium]OQY78081.1 MAG: 50S ribosomal protein L5 [I